MIIVEKPGLPNLRVRSGANPMKPIDWDIRREGRRWSHDEFDRRIYEAPEKIEYVNGIFASDRERLNVLGMLLENLGIDRAIRFGRLADWKAAIADLEKQPGSGNET
jgi:hypothetical protein